MPFTLKRAGSVCLRRLHFGFAIIGSAPAGGPVVDRINRRRSMSSRSGAPGKILLHIVSRSIGLFCARRLPLADRCPVLFLANRHSAERGTDE